MADSVFRKYPSSDFALNESYFESEDEGGSLISSRSGLNAAEILEDFFEADAGGTPTSVSATMAGGAVAGGSALSATTRAAQPAGGAIAGGIASADRERSTQSQGGGVLGGTVSSSMARAVDAAGGAVAGGTSEPSRTVSLESSGGAVAGGEAAAEAISSQPAETVRRGGIFYFDDIAEKRKPERGKDNAADEEQAALELIELFLAFEDKLAA